LIFSKSKLIFFISVVPIILLLGYWASLREVTVDTEVYYLFYESIINYGWVGPQSCQSFEPLFCATSYFVSSLTDSPMLTHFFWVILFYGVTLKSFLIFWRICLPNSPYSFISLICFIFVSINYIDPQIIYFLTRQYVASSFLVLGLAYVAVDKNPKFPLIIALLIHFGSIPISILIYTFSRRKIINRNMVIVLILISIFLFYFDSYIIEIYYESVKLKN
jgi:hypothetical protein